MYWIGALERVLYTDVSFARGSIIYYFCFSKVHTSTLSAYQTTWSTFTSSPNYSIQGYVGSDVYTELLYATYSHWLYKCGKEPTPEAVGGLWQGLLAIVLTQWVMGYVGERRKGGF